jgi:hypothetical protein
MCEVVRRPRETSLKRSGCINSSCRKFRHYLLGGHFKMFTDHSELKYLSQQASVGGRICRWLLLFQEYDFEIVVKPGRMNKGPDHLSRLEHGEEPTSLEDTLPDAQLLAIRKVDDHFIEIVQFLSTGMAPRKYTVIQKKQLVVRAADFSLIAGQLYKMGPDEILRRCIMEAERPLILAEAHEGITGGHYAGKETACRRFLELASGGPLYTKMLRNTTEPVMYAKELGNLPEEMRFL